MNLNISYNWLKNYVKCPEAPRDFAKKLSLSGPSIDHTTEKKPNFEKVVVGQIIKIENHPNADKLHICQVNVGDETLQIVCGASNIAEGQKVPVVLIGGRVGDFEIKQAKLRGIDSFGMMCSMRELGLSEDHAGIFILPDYSKIGLPLEKLMPIEDVIFDVEVTSNRPDAMSVVGIAREAATIMGCKFTYEESRPNLKIFEEKKLAVNLKEPKACLRYQAIVMTDVKVGISPLYIQQRLISAGLRPINNLVDITNYILLELGQPMHVFDYDKLAKNEIIIRLAKEGEKILALDGKAYNLKSTNLVIADGEKPVAVAGVMGGELSAATAETKTIVLESANFNALQVRRTARGLDLHSDSSNLYEKVLSSEATNPALMRAIELVQEIAGGKVASKIYDERAEKFQPKIIKFDLNSVAKLLGAKIPAKQVKEILTSLGFNVVKSDSKNNDELLVTVPWWRDRDIEGEHDLIEEVARIYGYNNLPYNLPAGQMPVDWSIKNTFTLEDRIKNFMVGFAYAENYNYSFTSEKVIKNCFGDLENNIKVANPLSSDFEYLRTSLVPGLLLALSENENYDAQLRFFELSNVYIKKENNLPNESMKLGLAVLDKNREEAFFTLKSSVEALFGKLHIDQVEFMPLTENNLWQDKQAAEIKIGDVIIGQIGIISQDTQNLFGFKKVPAIAEIDFSELANLAKTMPVYHSIAKFPAVTLDLSVEVDTDISYQGIVKSIVNVNSLIKDIQFLSEYHGEKIAVGKKAIAFRISYQDENKTLSQEEAQGAHKQVVETLQKAYNIVIR